MKCRERRSHPVADRGHDDLILPAKRGGVNREQTHTLNLIFSKQRDVYLVIVFAQHRRRMRIVYLIWQLLKTL